MQEPQRHNLCSVLQKNMKAAQRKTYLHRIIYIISYASVPEMKVQESRSFIILMDSNIKLINDDYSEELITGFGLFYTGYIINVVEGPETSVMKHLRTIIESFDNNLINLPEVTRMKVLVGNYHINKRYFSSWTGRMATPPVLLDKIEPTTSIDVNFRYIQICAVKLFRIYDYLRNQPPNLLRAAMDNISDLCQSHLPEVILLDFLLESPGLIGLREYSDLNKTVPEIVFYDEIIWPLPPDFVPFNILGDEKAKKLIVTVPKDEKEEEKEDEIEGEYEDQEEDEKKEEPEKEEEMN